MKKFYSLALLLSFCSLNAFSQKSQESLHCVAGCLSVSVTNVDLLLSWTGDDSATQWQVQGSADGRTYTTIGLVWDADPNSAVVSFKFKQKLSRLKPGIRYYKVVAVNDNTGSSVGNTIYLSK